MHVLRVLEDLRFAVEMNITLLDLRQEQFSDSHSLLKGNVANLAPDSEQPELKHDCLHDLVSDFSLNLLLLVGWYLLHVKLLDFAIVKLFDERLGAVFLAIQGV